MKLTSVSEQMTYAAERFLLRPPRRSDLGVLEMATSDARVARMTREIPHPLPPGAMASLIERASADDRTEEIWILDGSESGLGEVLGQVSLQHMDRNQSEISFWVVPGLWGSGIASEAVKTLLDANPLASEAVFAAVFQDNPASSRVLGNLGFAFIGEASYFSVARDTQVPTWTYVKSMM